MLRTEVWAKTRSWAPSAHGVSDGSELASGVLCSSGQRVGEEDRTLRKGNRCAPSSQGSECFEKGVANEGLENKPRQGATEFHQATKEGGEPCGEGAVGADGEAWLLPRHLYPLHLNFQSLSQPIRGSETTHPPSAPGTGSSSGKREAMSPPRALMTQTLP